MTRIFTALFLIISVGLFWYLYLSKTTGYLYNIETQSRDFLYDNPSELNLFSFSTSENVEKIFKFWASKGIKVIVGPPTSSEGQMILPYLKKYNIVSLSATISSDKMLNSGYIFSFTPANSYLIRKIENLLELKTVKRLLLILDPNNRAYSDEFLKLLEAVEGTSVYYYDENSLKKLNISEYDAALMTIFAEEAADVAKYLKTKNPSIIIIGTDSVMSRNYLEDAGSYSEGTYLIYSMNYLSNPETELITEVVSFLSKHKFLSADQLKRYLKSNIVETPVGKFHFSEGSIQRPPRVFKVVNGELVEQSGL